MVALTPDMVLDFKIARRTELTKGLRSHPNRFGSGWELEDFATIFTRSHAHQHLVYPWHAKSQLHRCLLLSYMALLYFVQNL